MMGSWVPSCSLLSLSQQNSDFFFFCPRPKINWGILPVPQELLMIPLLIPPEVAVEPAQPKLFQSNFLPLDSPPPNFPPLDEQLIGQS